MKKILLLFLMCAATVLSYAQNASVVGENSTPKKVVIYARNDTGTSELDGKTKALELSLSARVNNVGFSVINHDLVIRNLNDYLKNPNSKYREEASKIKSALQEESLDSKLFANASGLRLSEMLGTDYIIFVSLSSFGGEKKSFSGYGVKTSNVVYNLRANYNLYEGGIGAGTSGGTLNSDKIVRQTENLEINDGDVLNELIDKISEQMASSLDARNKSDKIVVKTDARGKITIKFVIEEMSMPEIIKKDGNYVVSPETVAVAVKSVNADIDGISRTIGGTIELSKGIHSFKINQKDIEPVEKNIFVSGNGDQQMDFSLQLTKEARERWKRDMAFIEEIKNRAKASDERRIITEAEAERIRAIGVMYEHSGFKVDAKALPEINKTQSMFSN